jgi:hypothetical protein
MSRIRRLWRGLIRPASPPGAGEPRASQLHGRGPVLATGPGRDGLAACFSRDLAAGASVAAGQDRPVPTIMSSWWRTGTPPRLVPHTIQLCIHCRRNPAGFWVSDTSGQTARRPWCLSCCQDLDPRCHHIKPFDG